MKMKYRWISVLWISVLLFCICMAGCSSVNEVTTGNDAPETEAPALKAYMVGTTDCTTNSFGEIYPFWSHENRAGHLDESAPQTMTITFNGQTYTGTYDETYVRRYATYLEHVYRFENARGYASEFTVHAETDELMYIRFDSASELKISEEKAEKIAFAVADQYINRDEYILTVEKSDLAIRYHYDKYIGGVKTSEYFIVSVTGEGEILDISKCNLGAFPSEQEKLSAGNLQKFETLSKDIGKKFAIEQAEKICTGYVADKMIEEKKLVALENGEIGMVYCISMQETLEYDTQEVGCGTIELLVK